MESDFKEDDARQSTHEKPAKGQKLTAVNLKLKPFFADWKIFVLLRLSTRKTHKSGHKFSKADTFV